MQIVYKFSLNQLKNIVEEKAKFQKVLLIYDDVVSNLTINELYNSIKNFCIFNSMNINKLDYNEINNGYKMLIFMCCANNFLNSNINCEDFVNIFIPQNNDILPFCLDKQLNSKIANNNNKDVIFLNENVDIKIVFSAYFNNFLTYYKNIFLGEQQSINKSINLDVVNNNAIINLLNKNIKYQDVAIVKSLQLDYYYLPLVDYLLLNGFYILITCIKTKTLNLTDIYKESKNDEAKIDLYFSKVFNEAFYQLIRLNFFNLQPTIKQYIANLQNFLECFEYSYNDINLITNKLKVFCKNDDGVFLYLYLFKIFE